MKEGRKEAGRKDNGRNKEKEEKLHKGNKKERKTEGER